MALVLGTNAGFVTVAPVSNPNGTSVGQDGAARAHKHTTPVGIRKITEIGWWHNDITVGSYELGLYSHNAGTDLPDVLLYSTVVTNSAGAAGWETQVVDWDVDPSTIYWLALQIDAISGDVQTDRSTVGGRTSIDVGITTLQDPWVNDGLTTYIMATYAVVEQSALEEGTKTVTASAIVSLVSENYASNQGVVPDRPSDYNGNLYWDEDTGAWGNTRTIHPGNWVQQMLAISEEGDIYFRTL